MNQETKKRKTTTSARAKAVPATIGEAWELLKKGSLRVFKSIADYLDDLAKTEGDAGELMASSYYKSANMECKFFVPHEFRSLSVKRSERGEVVEISDPAGDAIQGKTLVRLLVTAFMKEKGIGKMILGEVTDDRVEVLVVPTSVQFETGDDAKKGNNHKDMRLLYTHKARTTVYPSNDNIKELIGLSYVGVADIGNLVRSLNSVVSREGLIEFDLQSFGNIDVLQHALDDASVKHTRKHFLQTLLAAGIRAMTTEQRVAQFQKNPSYTLANNLELSLPHSGPLYTKLGNKPTLAVALGSVGDDANILMATNILSQKDYREIVGDVASYPVYVDSENLGGRRGPKFAEMHHKKLEKASHVANMLASISTSNIGEKSNVVSTEATAAKTEGVNYIDLE